MGGHPSVIGDAGPTWKSVGVETWWAAAAGCLRLGQGALAAEQAC